MMFPALWLDYVIRGVYGQCRRISPSLQNRKTRVAITQYFCIWTPNSQEAFRCLPVSCLPEEAIHQGCKIRYQFNALSHLFLWKHVRAALKGEDWCLVFEMRSHSIRNKPRLQQNSPSVWRIATAFLFKFQFLWFPYSYSSPSPCFCFLHLPEQPGECRGRLSWQVEGSWIRQDEIINHIPVI